MARRGGGDGGGGMAAPLIGITVTLLVFVILEIFAPTIAGTIQAAQPSTTPVNERCWAGGLPGNYSPCTGTENITWPSQAVGDYTEPAGNGESGWNSSGTTYDIPQGDDTWITVVQIIGVVFLIIAISIAIFYLKGM